MVEGVCTRNTLRSDAWDISGEMLGTRMTPDRRPRHSMRMTLNDLHYLGIT